MITVELGSIKKDEQVVEQTVTWDGRRTTIDPEDGADDLLGYVN